MKRDIFPVVSMMTISLWVLFSGCESTLDLPLSNQPKLTIISHIAPGSWERQQVFVYASQSPSDSSQFYTPAHVQVEVTELETDQTITLDSTKEGNKLFFEFPQGFLKAGFTYSISAYAPGFGSVHATTLIPKPSTISNLRINNVNIQPSDKNEFKSIVRYNLSFNIEHFKDNRYYHVVFYNKYLGYDDAFIVDPELSDNQPFLPHYDFGVLIDREDLKPGEPLTFYFVDWVVQDHDLKRVYVELRSISEEYYKYQCSLARQVLVRQDPFAEPVSIYNNIEGGYGNFSGFTPDVSSSDLPQ